MVEDAIKYYVEAYDMTAVSLVIYDTFGADDTRGKIISTLIENMKLGNQLDISPGEQKIDIVYIDDIIAAYYYTFEQIMNQSFKGNLRYCLRSGREVTIKKVVEIMEDISGKKLNILWGGRSYRKREVMNIYTEGIILPGWVAKVSLEEGIQKCLEYNCDEK